MDHTGIIEVPLNLLGKTFTLKMEEIFVKKIAILFGAFFCLAMITGSCSAATLNSATTFNSNTHCLKTIYVLSNPSTGYFWYSKYDDSKVKLLCQEYIPIKPIMIGSGGVEVFKFSGPKGSIITLYKKAPDGSTAEIRKYII